MFILLTLFVQVYTKELALKHTAGAQDSVDKLLDKLLNELADRVLKALPFGTDSRMTTSPMKKIQQSPTTRSTPPVKAFQLNFQEALTKAEEQDVQMPFQNAFEEPTRMGLTRTGKDSPISADEEAYLSTSLNQQLRVRLLDRFPKVEVEEEEVEEKLKEADGKAGSAGAAVAGLADVGSNAGQRESGRAEGPKEKWQKLALRLGKVEARKRKAAEEKMAFAGAAAIEMANISPETSHRDGGKIASRLASGGKQKKEKAAFFRKRHWSFYSKLGKTNKTKKEKALSKTKLNKTKTPRSLRSPASTRHRKGVGGIQGFQGQWPIEGGEWTPSNNTNSRIRTGMRMGSGGEAASLYLGIDPGVSGAMALITDDGRFVAAIKGDETPKDIWDWLAARRDLIDFAALERVHSMPPDGVRSSFRFGESFGFLQGLLVASGIRYDLVAPHVWQKELSCNTRGNKAVTKMRAQQLWPSVKITHALADALLIAEYARRKRQSFEGRPVEVGPCLVPTQVQGQAAVSAEVGPHPVPMQVQAQFAVAPTF